jgi:DNA-binding NarL/FixJ family response regulator
MLPSARALLRAYMSAAGTLKVMLVEDHAAFREALALLLSRQPDLEVVAQAGSLAEAKEALKDEHIDVAVVDLGLPDGDGRELFAELRESNPGISVVVLSATIEAGHIDDVLRAGADVVLDKIELPLTIAEEVGRLGRGG